MRSMRGGKSSDDGWISCELLELASADESTADEVNAVRKCQPLRIRGPWLVGSKLEAALTILMFEYTSHEWRLSTCSGPITLGRVLTTESQAGKEVPLRSARGEAPPAVAETQLKANFKKKAS